MPLTPPESQDTPAPMLQAPVTLALGQPGTITIPADSPRDWQSYWFRPANQRDTSDPLFMTPPRPGNEVKYLLGGEAAYASMAEAMQPLGAPGGHNDGSWFVYVANWWVNQDFALDGHGHTLRDYLYNAAHHNGCMVRALLWNRTATPSDVEHHDTTQPDQNRVEAAFVNGLPGGHAILDGRHNTFGSHHMKLLMVNGPDGLIAFMGGLDFNYDRKFIYGEAIPSPQGDDSNRYVRDHHRLSGAQWSPGSPLLDVHVRIRGPAAYDLLDIFLRRYADNPDAAGKTIVAPRRDYSTHRGEVTVRVGCTLGDDPNAGNSAAAPAALGAMVVVTATPWGFVPDQATATALGGAAAGASPVVTVQGRSTPAPTGKLRYSFAPGGRQSGRAQLLHAISAARKFVYFEDQYMVSAEIAQALRRALDAGLQFVLGVIPHQTLATDYAVEPAMRRTFFIDYLNDPRFLVFCPVRPQPDRSAYPGASRYQYVHSKVFVYDDEFCTVGSMNNNLRSTTHDTELSCGFYEQVQGEQPRLGFPRWLRMKLWARHLGMDQHPDQLHHLADAATALNWWRQVHAGQQVSIGGANYTPAVERYDWSNDPEYSSAGMGDMATDAIGDISVTQHPVTGLSSRRREP